MRSVILCAVVVLCACAHASAEVKILTDDSFPKDFDQPWFIEFYAPWCGHCKNLAPVWDDASVQLADLATFAKVDCTVEVDVAKRYEIRGFPTLKVFHDGKVHDYSGPRTVDGFRDFLEGDFGGTNGGKPIPKPEPTPDASLPSKVTELTDETFEHLTQASTGATTGNWFVMVYASWCGHCKSLHPTWETLAHQLSGETVIAKIEGPANRDTEQRFKVQAYPTLLFIEHGKVHKYTGPRSADDLAEFARRGYRDHDSELVPPPRSFMDDVWSMWEEAKADFATLAKYKKNVLALTFVFGMLCGVLILGIIWNCVSGAEVADDSATTATAEDSAESKKDK